MFVCYVNCRPIVDFNVNYPVWKSNHWNRPMPGVRGWLSLGQPRTLRRCCPAVDHRGKSSLILAHKQQNQEAESKEAHFTFMTSILCGYWNGSLNGMSFKMLEKCSFLASKRKTIAFRVNPFSYKRRCQTKRNYFLRIYRMW